MDLVGDDGGVPSIGTCDAEIVLLESHGLHQTLEADVTKAVGTDDLTDLIDIVLVGDELDNAAELIALLEAAPEPILPLAVEKKEETTFLFGPDLADQLRKKRQIMLAHWRDSQVLFEFKNRFNQI